MCLCEHDVQRGWRVCEFIVPHVRDEENERKKRMRRTHAGTDVVALFFRLPVLFPTTFRFSTPLRPLQTNQKDLWKKTQKEKEKKEIVHKLEWFGWLLSGLALPDTRRGNEKIYNHAAVERTKTTHTGTHTHTRTHEWEREKEREREREREKREEEEEEEESLTHSPSTLYV